MTRFEEMFVATALQKSSGREVWFMEQLAPETLSFLCSIASRFYANAGHLINPDSMRPCSEHMGHIRTIANCLWDFNQGDRDAFKNTVELRFSRAFDLTKLAGEPEPVFLIKDGARIVVSTEGKTHA